MTSSEFTTWYAVYSDKRQREYYYNPETQESTWILPDNAHPSPLEYLYSSTDEILDDYYAEEEGDDDGSQAATFVPRWIHVQRTRLLRNRSDLVAAMFVCLCVLFAIIAAPLAKDYSQNPENSIFSRIFDSLSSTENLAFRRNRLQSNDTDQSKQAQPEHLKETILLAEDNEANESQQFHKVENEMNESIVNNEQDGYVLKESEPSNEGTNRHNNLHEEPTQDDNTSSEFDLVEPEEVQEDHRDIETDVKDISEEHSRKEHTDENPLDTEELIRDNFLNGASTNSEGLQKEETIDENVGAVEDTMAIGEAIVDYTSTASTELDNEREAATEKTHISEGSILPSNDQQIEAAKSIESIPDKETNNDDENTSVPSSAAPDRDESPQKEKATPQPVEGIIEMISQPTKLGEQLLGDLESQLHAHGLKVSKKKDGIVLLEKQEKRQGQLRKTNQPCSFPFSKVFLKKCRHTADSKQTR